MPAVKIDKDIFERFPDFRRGIVIASGMNNSGGSEELEIILHETVAKAAENPVELNTYPATAVWRETYRALGCNPKKFPPAHLSLLKRVQKPGASIPFINKAVAVMNINSISGILPVGGDDLEMAGETLVLRKAAGNEKFIPLDAPDRIEKPEEGEIIYIAEDTGEIMCRRWNWRNGFLTRIKETTGSIVMNIDGLGEGSESRVAAIRDRVAEMLERFCGAAVETALLTPEAPSYTFSLEK